MEPTPARTFDEVHATQGMLECTRARFGLAPKRLAADTAYGTGKFLGWLVEHQIAPPVPVWDKSTREDGTFSRSDFAVGPEQDQYTCPAGKLLKQYRRNFAVPRHDSAHDGIRKYVAAQRDCRACDLKGQCCPNMPSRAVQRARGRPRSGARSRRHATVRAITQRREEGRDVVRAPENHAALRAHAAAWLERCA